MRMKREYVEWLWVFVLGIGLAGTSTFAREGKGIEAENNNAGTYNCPTCKSETRTLPLLGIKYKKHVCPSCRSAVNYNTEAGENDLWRAAHVCDTCETVVDTCAFCRKKGYVAAPKETKGKKADHKQVLVSAEIKNPCPTCKTETRASKLFGLKYTKHVCPSCKTTSEYFAEDWDTSHVCDTCKTIVAKCDQCKKKTP